VRTALTSSFVSCKSGGKWWPLGSFLLEPASSVAAGDGVPPRGRRRPVGSRPHPPSFRSGPSGSNPTVQIAGYPFGGKFC
jgi:hypothetical protein